MANSLFHDQNIDKRDTQADSRKCDIVFHRLIISFRQLSNQFILWREAITSTSGLDIFNS